MQDEIDISISRYSFVISFSIPCLDAMMMVNGKLIDKNNLKVTVQNNFFASINCASFQYATTSDDLDRDDDNDDGDFYYYDDSGRFKVQTSAWYS